MINTLSKQAFVKAKQALAPILPGLNHLLWPEVCNICRDPITNKENGLCPDCWKSLLTAAAGDYCPRCGWEASKYALLNNSCGHCQSIKINYDAIARAGLYEGTLRDMILAFKFHDRTDFQPQFHLLADSALRGSTFFDEVNLFVPVPLHWLRRLQRGFNQSLLIAKGLKHPTAKISTDLVRIRYTKRQWNLTPAHRRKNVAGAFAVRRDHNFHDKVVCLVDDITTSRATLNECAKALKLAGAKKVHTLVLAVAMQGNS